MSRQILRISICFLSLLISGFSLRAQTVDEALAKLNNRYPEEKAHLQLDKDFYIIGETIHFKAFLYGTSLPSLNSIRFYAQVFDKKGNMLSESVFPVSGATAVGSITLSDTLPAGNYLIRAFTPWMLNAGETYLFHQPFRIIDPKTKAGLSQSPSGGTMLNLKFFPESGSMIDGVVCAVAIQATTGTGLPADAEGNIIMEDGTVISSFKTLHDGMGKTQFKPIAGNKYFAEVEVAGKPTRFPLPEVQSSGVNIKVIDEKAGKLFQIARTEKTKKEFENLHLIVVQHKLIVFETDVAFEDYPSVRGHLLTDNLPTGILQFVLLKDNVPLAERLSFVNNNNYSSKINLSAKLQSTANRAKNTFELSFPDSLQRSLSVSVTDADVAVPGRETIYSRYLLTNDLGGTVYNPDWYFSAEPDSVKAAMDLLMMTHSWNRYRWENVLKGEFPPLAVKDPGLLKIAGTVTDNKDKTPVKGGTLTLLITDTKQTPSNYEVKVDDLGHFEIDSLLFFGKSKVSYEYFTTKGKPQVVTVIPLDKADIKTAPGAADLRSIRELLQSEPGYVKGMADFIQMMSPEEAGLATNGKTGAVDEKANDSLSTDQKYAQGVFTKEARSSFDLVKDPPKNRNQNVVDFIRQNIPQVQYSNGGFVSKKNFSLGGGASSAWPVTIYLDNQISNSSTIQGLMMTDVALIKFYETGFFGAGTSASGGTIAVFSKRGPDVGGVNTDQPFFFVDGFSPVKELFQPDYDQKGTNINTDHRATLYWNASVLTGGTTRTFSFDFFNNDVTRRFRVVVEGFDATGKLVHLEKIIPGTRGF